MFAIALSPSMTENFSKRVKISKLLAIFQEKFIQIDQPSSMKPNVNPAKEAIPLK